MYKSRYSKEIQDLITMGEKSRTTDPETALDCAGRIRKAAKGEEELVAYSNWLYANAYYYQNDSVSCVAFLNKAIDDYSQLGEKEKLCECWNIMGNVHVRASDFAKAMDSYFRALRIIEKNDFPLISAVVYMNCADLCMQLGSNSDALHNIMIAETYLERAQDDHRYGLVASLAFSEGSTLAFEAGERDTMEGQLARLRLLLKKYPDMEDQINVQLALIVHAKLTGNQTAIDELLHHAFQAQMKDNAFLDCNNETLMLLKLLREHNHQEEIEKLFRKVDEYQDSSANLTAIISYRVAYYQETGTREQYQNELENFWNYSQKSNEMSQHAMIQLFRATSDLNASQRTNERLRREADTDPLTSLANRRRFNEEAERYFDDAKEEGYSLGVEMLDIDDFKQINDNYGHAAGDDVLIMMGSVLSSMRRENMFSARYGGDEFIILSLSKSDEDLQYFSEELKKRIGDAVQKRKLPPVTISQGIVNRIPAGLNRVWDYTSAADLALYYVKKHGKDGTLLVHHASEIPES